MIEYIFVNNTVVELEPHSVSMCLTESS